MSDEPIKQPKGFAAFSILWLGQVLSLLGSAMTWFALTIWVWGETGSATSLAMVSFFVFLPTALLSPVAGVFVDRWNRKLVMALSDFATALGTLIVYLLYVNGLLQIWHIYLVGGLAGFFTAFQYPAYAAVVPQILPKEHYTRAEGMMGLAYAASGILAPVLGAALLGSTGIETIMLIDLGTFLFAFGSLIWIYIPKQQVTEVGLQGRGNLWHEISFGFRYIRERVSLWALVLLFMASNFFLSLGATLMAPMILSYTGNDETALALVQSIGAIGGVVGGGILTVWGGPKLRIHGVLSGGIGAAALGMIWLGLAQGLWMWAIGSFFFSFFEPFVEGGNLAIWQSKVEGDVQGKVFSARQFMVQITYLLAMLVAGPLARMGSDIFESGNISHGMSLVLVIAGLGALLSFGSGYISSSVRNVEKILPDQIRGLIIKSKEE